MDCLGSCALAIFLFDGHASNVDKFIWSIGGGGISFNF